MHKKIVDLNTLLKKLKKQRKGCSIGFITGCFDILHTGHIDLLSFGKKHVDILIVGIDTDEAIRKTKGSLRPVHTQTERAWVLSSIEHIDYILTLTNTHNFTTEKANKYHDDLISRLKPTHLITGKNADPFWEKKKRRIEATGGTLLIDERKRSTSSSSIVNKIMMLD